MGYSVFMTEQITADVARAFQSGDMAQVVALVENLPARARDSNETALLAYGLALHSLRRNREAAAALRQLDVIDALGAPAVQVERARIAGLLHRLDPLVGDGVARAHL